MKQTYQSANLGLETRRVKFMKPNKLFVILALCAISLSRLGTVGLYAQTWDVIDETYGNGTGEVSFNAL